MEVLKKAKVGLVLSVLALLVFASCKSPVTSPHEGQVTFSVSNLPVLPDGLTYEGWLVYPNGIKSAGKFRVNSNGSYTGTVTALNLGALVGFEVSIEPANDSLDDISGAVVLAGEFGSDSVATLDMSPWAALALGRIGLSDTMEVSGKYFLHVYTDSTAPYYYGIWAGEVYTPGNEDSVRKSFNLPTLSEVWDYAGWVKDVQSGDYYLLGRFGDFGDSDNDGPGPYPGSNTDNAPNLPGGEFVTTPTPLTLNSGSYQFIVTLQPKFVPDSLLPVNGFPVLVESDIPQSASDLENISVTDSISLNWTGSVIRKY